MYQCGSRESSTVLSYPQRRFMTCFSKSDTLVMESWSSDFFSSWNVGVCRFWFCWFKEMRSCRTNSSPRLKFGGKGKPDNAAERPGGCNGGGGIGSVPMGGIVACAGAGGVVATGAGAGVATGAGAGTAIGAGIGTGVVVVGVTEGGRAVGSVIVDAVVDVAFGRIVGGMEERKRDGNRDSMWLFLHCLASRGGMEIHSM